jgi:hypothetical protein
MHYFLRSLKTAPGTLIAFFARADLFCYALIWLMILLIIGTLAQQQEGLYLAQQHYFSVYYFWYKQMIPLPGAYSTLGFIALALLAKFYQDPWIASKLGTHVLHLAALLLLLGGFLTAYFSQEGQLTLAPGQSHNALTQDYHTELIITDLTHHTTTRWDADLFKHQQQFYEPFVFAIERYCEHCDLDFKPLPQPKNREEATPALTLNINTHRYQLHVDVTHPFNITVSQKPYQIAFRHTQIPLPFSITLLSFKIDFYPKTRIARSYESVVRINDLNTTSQALISMNKPLHYKGYTFYQASFIDHPPAPPATVLAGVKNMGRHFPYLSSLLLCLGLLIHLFQRLPALWKNANT